MATISAAEGKRLTYSEAPLLMSNQSDLPKIVCGPNPELLKIDGDWEEAIRIPLGKKKPADGWPEQHDKEPKETR